MGPANDAVGDVDAKPGEFDCTFFAQRWAKVYHDWINPETIQPWCISRQLWWGHRIPAYYCDDCGEVMVSIDPVKKCTKCESTNIHQDPDVLDTWFSSWLWPLTTLGWPDETDDLKKFYPTNFLLTAYDIIFFWVARMIIAGYEFRNATPFYEVVYTGLIRDEHGKKMSKSSGNAVDPMDLIEEYGRDALRFTLTHLSFSGSQDINLAPTRLQGSRYFMNKVWNVSKYVIGQIGADFTPTPLDELYGNQALTLPDRWILSKLASAVHGIEKELKIYDFGKYADILYSFVWDDFCDWYVEISKFHLGENDASERRQLVRSILWHTLETILRLLHPISPYISEELHAALYNQGEMPGKSSSEYVPLIVESWPGTYFTDKKPEPQIEADFARLQTVVRAFRNNRKSIGLADSATVKEVMYLTSDDSLVSLITEIEQDLRKLVNVSKITSVDDPPSRAISASLFDNALTTFLPIDESMNLEKEIEKLEKEIEKKSKYAESVSKKLNNENFTEKAPPKVIEKEQEKLSEAEVQIKELKSRLKIFKDAMGR